MDPKPPGGPPNPSAPPPVPPAARRPPPPPPPGSTRAKIDVAATALRLRDEQIQAKVIYFGADQRTNSELDAITENVIAELKAIQSAAARTAPAVEDRSQLEIELIGALRSLLEKLFSSRREGFLRRKIEDISRRITTLFFNSELYAKISAGGGTAESRRLVTFADQAVFYAIARHKDALVADLRAQQYEDPAVLAEALDRLVGIEKGLRMAFLSQTTPELERLLEVFREVLANFFFKDFRESLGEFCWEVIRDSRVAQGKLFGYKLGAESFEAFRTSFDKKFLERLVLNVQEPILQRAGAQRDVFREDTRRFVADPHIFSEICAAICNACYDYLHSEGFLDLPAQWRAHLYRS